MNAKQTIPRKAHLPDNNVDGAGNGLSAHQNEYGEYMTTDEASKYMRRSASFIIRQKDIPYLPGHPNTYRRKDLDAWFEENKRTPLMG